MAAPRDRVARPPGPKGDPLLGSLRQLRSRPLELMVDLTRHYGPVSFTRFGGANVYCVSHPDLVEELLVGRHKDCSKDFATRELTALVGNGLLTNEGAPWLRQRRLAAPPLQPKRIANYADTMADCAARAFRAFRDDEVRDIHRDMTHVTLEIAGRTLLGADPRREAERIGHVLDVAMVYFDKQLRTPQGLLPKWVPTPDRVRMKQAVAELDAIVYRIIARCRRDDADADHLLARLMAARDEQGNAMSDVELRDEAVTLLLAGHETTALALSYAVYLLSAHPEIGREAQAEIDAAIGGRRIVFEDLPKLRLLDAIMRETLRLYPSAYAMAREATTSFELGGWRIPKGDQILMSQYAIQRDPRWFREPEAFRPARWLSGETRELPKFAYFPFGGGPRICIGNHFAMMEAVIVLAALLQEMQLRVLPGFRLRQDPVVTLRPAAGGIPVLVRRRTPSVGYRAA
jgi:cytochrome P450